MALVLTEEQSMLRDSARGLISDKAPVSHLRGLRDAKDATGFSRELWKAFAEMGFSRPAGAGEFRRQRARLRRGRRGDGGNRPHADAVAVPCDRRARGLGAVARRQRGAEGRASAEDCGRLAARGARDRRGRKTSPAADQIAGGAFRQRFQAQRRQGLCGRRPHRRSPDRRRPHRRRRRRAQRADAVSGRSQGQGHCGRAHRDGRFAQCGPHRIRQCRGQRRQRARRGRSGRRRCWKACSISAAARSLPKWSA